MGIVPTVGILLRGFIILLLRRVKTRFSCEIDNLVGELGEVKEYIILITAGCK